MAYQIHITQTAEKDLLKAADYIEYVLKNPDAADNLLDVAEQKINDLSDFPARNALVEDSVLASWGIRFTVINHYLAFYLIDENNHIVHVVRFLFGKSDWISILKHGISLF